ncbi:MAG TPA: CvpA family protein, partial [Chromatiales bacterium]|nr:CvpA family protein [Chromatiales bacterium]
EALSLGTWVLAFWVAWTFFRELAIAMEPWIATQSVRLGVSFAILVTATLIIGGIVNYLVAQLVEKTGLSGTDRLIGVVFGAARGVLLVAILVLLAGLTPMPEDTWWKQSSMIPYFQEIALWLKQFLPPDIAAKFSY